MITRNNTGPPSFAEAAAVMMSGGQTVVGGGGAKLITKNIYKNGVYLAKDDKADGYSQVGVYVPTVANITSLSVTENGVYYATSGIDGYSPVSVNVPDRYDEGYKKGYQDGHADGYSEGYSDGYDNGYSEGYQDGYSDGYKKGKSDGGYKFPPGTPPEDIIAFASKNNAEISQENAEYSFAVYIYPYTGEQYPNDTAKTFSYAFYCGAEFVVYRNGEVYDGLNAYWSWRNSSFRFDGWDFSPSTGQGSITYSTDTVSDFTKKRTFNELVDFMTGDNPVSITN